MAGAVVFEAVSDLAATRKVLKEAEEDTRLGMRDHLNRFRGQQGCLFSPLLLHHSHGLQNSVVKKCPPEVGVELEAALRRHPSWGSGAAAAAGFLALGPRAFVLPLLGRLRNVLARSQVPDLDVRSDSFTWVVDFPLFIIGR